MRALVVDVGSTSVRTALVDDVGHVSHVAQQRLTVTSPQPGEVELDAEEIGHLTLELAQRTLRDGGSCDVVGVTNQRATTVVFDPVTSQPVGPALSWQDLRTVIDCLVLQGSGLRFAPNQSATKIKWLVQQSGRSSSELRFATVESYVTWLLTRGDVHVSDHSNAAVTGVVTNGAQSWDESVLHQLDLDPVMMPRIVNTIGEVGRAIALPGSPPIYSLVGDQSASLFGQSCVSPGTTKITFGTGAMLDLVRGNDAPDAMTRYSSGCFPVVARSAADQLTWGVEAMVLTAGTCMEWLRDDLGLIATVEESAQLAQSVASTDGVSFVPALLGLGTPQWDFGARAGFFGLTRGSSRAHLVRAVLEGIAHRGADLIEAASLEIGEPLHEVRVDGGMTANRFLLQALADASGCRVSVSAEREATTKGAGLMALVGAGALSCDDVENLWRGDDVVEPQVSADQRENSRASWATAVARAERTLPDLSSVEF